MQLEATNLDTNSSPVISVIIPTFRRWEHLCDAIESVFNQTFTDWEIVVVNDGGGPPHGRVIDLLNNPKVKYIEHQVNLDRSAARNTGHAHSSGEYIAYLDDDDIFYPNHLETMINALTKNSWDVVYTDAYKGVYEKDDGNYKQISKEIEYSIDFGVERLLQGNFIPIICLAHKKECQKKTGGFDPAFIVQEDWELWLRMCRYFVFHHIPVVTAEYRVRLDKTNTTTNTNKDLWDRTTIAMYSKFLSGLDPLQDKRLQSITRSRISRCVRKMYQRSSTLSWHERVEQYDQKLVRSMILSDWIRMFFKMPLLTMKFQLFVNQSSNRKSTDRNKEQSY